MLNTTIRGVWTSVVYAMDGVPGSLQFQVGLPQLTFWGNFLGTTGIVIAREISR